MPNPSTIRTQVKRFKETVSVNNKKVNRRCHVLTEKKKTLDEIGERNRTEITVSVWEQRQYADPLVGKPASQGRERQPSIAARGIWEALYLYQYLCTLIKTIIKYILRFICMLRNVYFVEGSCLFTVLAAVYKVCRPIQI